MESQYSGQQLLCKNSTSFLRPFASITVILDPVDVRDKLAAIRDVWDKWVDMLPLLYNPGPHVTVDERFVPFSHVPQVQSVSPVSGHVQCPVPLHLQPSPEPSSTGPETPTNSTLHPSSSSYTQNQDSQCNLTPALKRPYLPCRRRFLSHSGLYQRNKGKVADQIGQLMF